jgi:hypothetical protein
MSKAKRKGRTRLPGTREPNGRLQRPSQSSPVVYWQRERDVLRDHSHRYEFESPAGLLFRAGKITAQEFEAARRFALSRRAADEALGLPPRSPRAMDMDLVRGHPSDDTPEVQRRRRAAIAAFDAAQVALGLGSPALGACLWICVYEQRPDCHGQLVALKEGLSKLVKHYGVRG